MRMAKLAIAAIAALFLSGCAGDYSVMEARVGPTRTTYDVQIQDDTSRARVEEIARELGTRDGTLITVVNFYDGPREPKNLVYACQGGLCYEARRRG